MGDGGTSLQESKCLAGIFSQIVTDCKVLKDKDKDRYIVSGCKVEIILLFGCLFTGFHHFSELVPTFNPSHLFVVSLGLFMSKVAAIELILSFLYLLWL